ncbi:MAG: hypothetical protein J7M26_01190 [Armatimonadetes bacterium]|nr:hypothetical protein [Armatimonadota bacterium]
MSRGRRGQRKKTSQTTRPANLEIVSWDERQARGEGSRACVSSATVRARLEELRSVFQRLAMALQRDLHCRLLILGEVLATRQAVRVLGLWPLSALTELERQSNQQELALLRCDEGLQSLERGEMDALVYASTAVSGSELARLFCRSGCTSAIVVPVVRWRREAAQSGPTCRAPLEGVAETSQEPSTLGLENSDGEMYFLAAGLAAPATWTGEALRRLLEALGPADSTGPAEEEVKAA